MTNYVPSIPDCERWKKYISKLAKGRTDSKLNSYGTSDSALSDIKVISPVEGDLALVKSRVKKYKQSTKTSLRQTGTRAGGGKTSTTKKKKKEKKSTTSKKGKKGKTASSRSKSEPKRGRPKGTGKKTGKRKR